VRQDLAGVAGLGPTRCDGVRKGNAGLAGLVGERRGVAMLGSAKRGRNGPSWQVRRGPSWRGKVRPVLAWSGLVGQRRQVEAGYGFTRLGLARQVKAQTAATVGVSVGSMPTAALWQRERLEDRGNNGTRQIY
jgi:hypothetical protein